MMKRKKLKVGDQVAVLDDIIEGRVLKLGKDSVLIQTKDGFEMEFPEDQLINLSSAEPINDNILFRNYSHKEQDKKSKKHKPQPNPTILEIDLHIEKLLPSVRGMSKHDILTHQLDTARRQLEFAISKRIPKLVLIHGVGDGVLKTELNFLLGRYNHIEFYDAPYVKYGFGATEVAISPNAARV